MTQSIFISYRHSDAAGHAGRLFDRLRLWFSDDDVFFDVDALETGDLFPKHIDRAIRGARVALVIIGPDWLETLNDRVADPEVDFVRREVEITIQRRLNGEVEVFPVLVGGAEMPRRRALHPELREQVGRLPNYQAHTFQGNQADWDHQFDRLRKRLAGVTGVPEPCFQVPLVNQHADTVVYNRSNPSFRHTSLNLPPPPRFNAQSVEQTFGTVSRTLLNWPQETEGQWIERPELEQLHTLLAQDKPALTALLGGPGEGKSAILARLGARLSKEGVGLLAIKADRIPRHVATLADLDDWIDCGIPVAEALRNLARERHVVVLIDQLDVLADLMDRHSERLSALLRLVDTLRDTPNIQVIVSCREFEFRNDVRLSTLDVKKVSLERLSWEKVEPLLTAHGLQIDGWNEEVRDVLRTPQHLAMFLEHLTDKDALPEFTTYQGLLNRIIRERLEKDYGLATVKAAEYIAIEMATEEELWLARTRFEHKFEAELTNLEAAGFLTLSESKLSLAFRHQTLFDFLRARAFLRDGHSLADYILTEKQESLFVRPVLWSTLNYLRGTDRAVYRREFRRLWTHNGLRLHLRYLLIDFLGQAAHPDDEEAQWLLPLLDDSAHHSRVLHAIARNPEWFSRIQSRLPSLMTAPPDDAWSVVGVLSEAVAAERDVVLRLVERYWAAHREHVPHASTVLSSLTSWDEESVEIAARLAADGLDDTYMVRRLVDKIAESRPNLAPKLIARCLRAQTNRIAAENSASTQGQSALENSSVSAPSRRYEPLLEQTCGWHDIHELATQAPRAFIEELWPWLNDILERIARQPHPHLNQYRKHNGLAFCTDGGFQYSLPEAIESSIRGFAEAVPGAFLDFVEAHKNSDLEVVHHLLALGLASIATTQPEAVLRYLLGDPRRFAVGNFLDTHADSRTLISTLVPALSNVDAGKLERAILAWEQYRSLPGNVDPKSRFEFQKWTREHRLRLLRSFPFERLSPQGKRHVREEERALPHTPDSDQTLGEAQFVESVMSAEQMGKATDDEILTLFKELTDDTTFHHPRPSKLLDHVGGSIQASSAFADFAKKAPDRALKIIRKFEAGITERPAGAALAELGQSNVSPAALIASIRDLDSRGFDSEHFRAHAARCLREVARRAGGLDDATCALLERWITDWRSAVADKESVSVTDHPEGPTENSKPEGDGRSLLWRMSGGHILPGGNYPFLDALMLGYLMRKPAHPNGWLAVLERHLTRSEDPKVWNAVTYDLRYLVNSDRPRAIAFLELLVSHYPDVLHTIAGVRLVATVLDWLPDKLLDRIVDRWISRGWENGPQAAGEVATLKLCRNPDDHKAAERVERFLTDGAYEPTAAAGLVLGIAHTLAVAWHEPALRALTTPLIVRLVPTADGSVVEALQAIFSGSDTLPADDHTRSLLEALLDHPSILVGYGRSLVDGMKGLLRDGWNPKLVYKVTKTVVGNASSALNDFRTSLPGIAGDLADIALTLHRLPETRTDGLELFERLMELDAYQLDERLRMIDRPAFR